MTLEKYLADTKPETLTELFTAVNSLSEDLEIRIIDKGRLEEEMTKSPLINKKSFANSHLYIFNYGDLEKMSKCAEISNYKIEGIEYLAGKLYVIVNLSYMEYISYMFDQYDNPKNAVYNYQGLLDYWDNHYTVYDRIVELCTQI